MSVTRNKNKKKKTKILNIPTLDTYITPEEPKMVWKAPSKKSSVYKLYKSQKLYDWNPALFYILYTASIIVHVNFH